ncbi:hypothetical protein JHK82_039598 [Glycine max]|nr:hypothetical protein JHK82_039598 [Glycine max]
MKKLYHKGTVHSLPPLISDELSFLPTTIFTLAATLSLEDREVLSYLISCSFSTFSNNAQRKNATKTDHSSSFRCSCFCCYTGYWIRGMNLYCVLVYIAFATPASIVGSARDLLSLEKHEVI